MLGPYLVLHYVADLNDIVKNRRAPYYSNAHSVILVATVSKPGGRADISDLIENYLHSISSWCHRLCIVLNSRKSNTMVVGRSRALDPQHPMITLVSTKLVKANEITVLRGVIDAKLTFEKHVRAVASSCRRKLGMVRKTWRLYGNPYVTQTSGLSYFAMFVASVLGFYDNQAVELLNVVSWMQCVY